MTFDKRIGFHNPENMKEYKKGSSFATAYFCKDVLPKDLIVEELKGKFDDNNKKRFRNARRAEKTD